MLRSSIFAVCSVALMAGCSSTGSDTTASAPAQKATVQQSSYTMEVTDIDYGSVLSDRRFKVSYSFPDEQGRFAVKSADETGVSEPIADPSEYGAVNDDLAASIVCKAGLRKLQTKPTYVVADRAYQSTYICVETQS